MTIADILMQRNIRIGEGGYWLIWDEDSEKWVIYQNSGGVVYKTANEAKAVITFLRLTNEASTKRKLSHPFDP